MRRKLVVIGAAVALVAGVGLGLWSRSRSRPEPGRAASAAPASTAAAPPSAAAPSQQQLEADIIKSGVTPERAKLLFSLAIGPLPGVEIPAGAVRDPSDFDGTPAVQAVYQVWEALTPEQRRAAAVLIDKSTASATAALTVDRTGLVPVAFRVPTDDKPAYDYGALLKDADGTLAALLNVPGIRYSYDVDYDPPQGTEYAHTTSWWRLTDLNVPVFNEWKAYPGGGCHITIRNQKFQPINESDAQASITHEMFHCFQQREEGTAENAISVHSWVQEGEAMWAMAAVVPGVRSVIEKDWNGYAAFPKKEYYARGQDAIGVFGHLSDVAGDELVWSKLLPMIKLAIGGDDPGPFNYLVQGNESAYYASWGSSYFLTPGKQPWTMTGPGHPPESGIAPEAMTVDVGTAANLGGVSAYQAQMLQLTGNAEVVAVGLLTGYGRLHDQGFGVDTLLDTSGTLALCVKSGGCKCPDGTPGASLFTKDAVAPLFVGLDGGDTTAQVAVVGKSVDDFCKQPDKKPPAPGGGAGGGGGGGGGGGDDPTPSPKKPPPGPSAGDAGDPHVTTFDSLFYDFQVVGEYTLVRSTKDDFIVQVRQVPVLGSKVVANIQAMATRLGGQRVTVSNENGTAVLRINGKAVSGDPPTLKGGSITRAMTMFGATYRFTWPDGTVVRADQLGRFCMNVTVEPAASRRGSLTGLLGNDDGSPDNDLVGKDNAPLGPHPNATDLTHSLADAWRVTEATSLFDYRPGQSTASFVDRAFPNANVDAAGVPNRAAAEKACQDEGITDSHLLDDCIVDLALTNEFLYGSAYGHAQQVLTARAALTKRVYATGQQLPVLLMSGTISEKTDQPQLQFKASAGDVIWIGQPDCNEHSNGYVVNLRLLDPQGKGPFASGCDLHRIPLSLSGTYTLKSEVVKNQFDDPTRSYHIPIHFVRHDRRQAISYGQTIAGNIDQPGAQDVYTFSAHAGDLLNITGPDCDLGTFVTGLIFPNGASGLGPGCRPGTEAKLPETGNYGLIINYFDTSTGSYHFPFRSGLDALSR